MLITFSITSLILFGGILFFSFRVASLNKKLYAQVEKLQKKLLVYRQHKENNKEKYGFSSLKEFYPIYLSLRHRLAETFMYALEEKSLQQSSQNSNADTLFVIGFMLRHYYSNSIARSEGPHSKMPIKKRLSQSHQQILSKIESLDCYQLSELGLHILSTGESLEEALCIVCIGEESNLIK